MTTNHAMLAVRKVSTDAHTVTLERVPVPLHEVLSELDTLLSLIDRVALAAP